MTRSSNTSATKSPVRAADLFAASTSAVAAEATARTTITTSPMAKEPTTCKRDAFSLADEGEEDENVLFSADASDKSDAVSAVQQQQAEANRSVAELAALEAELGLEGEDFAVSAQLELLGQDVAATAPAAPNPGGAAAAAAPDVPEATAEEQVPAAGSSTATLVDLSAELSDIDNMDLGIHNI